MKATEKWAREEKTQQSRESFEQKRSAENLSFGLKQDLGDTDKHRPN